MDGLSGAGSGIAVLTLAIQLASSVQNVQRFFRGVTNAPKEVERLVDLLGLLELTLDGIKDLLEGQTQRYGVPDPSPAIPRALGMCRQHVGLLEAIVDKAKLCCGKPNTRRRTWASLKLALKKRDMDDFERQLQQAFSTLHMTLTINSAQMNVFHSQQTLDFRNEMNQYCSNVQPTRTTVSMPLQAQASRAIAEVTSTDCADNSATAFVSKFQRKREHRWRSTMFGTMIYTKTSTVSHHGRANLRLNGSHSLVEEEGYFFIPSFGLYALEIQYQTTLGRIPRVMRVHPILDRYSPVFYMCQNGDLRGLQHAFDSHQVSPYSIRPDGKTLLHCAAKFAQLETCRLLLKIGVDAAHTDVFGRTAGHISLESPHIYGPEQLDTIRLLSSFIPNIDLASFRNLFICGPPERFEIILSRHDIHLCLEDVADGVYSILGETLRALGLTVNCGWKSVIRIALSLALKYNPNYIYCEGFLWELFYWDDDPMASQDLAKEWLDILSSMGVDPQRYLRHERDLYLEVSLLRNVYDRNRLLIFSFEEPPTVRWEWYTDPDGAAYMVLEEFKNFGPDSHNLFDPNFQHDWPYRYLIWHLWEKNGYPSRTGKQEAKLVEERFERREQKKATKLRKAQGFGKPLRIPGAWVE
ncbi:MAG: hypothetical protein M1833_007379 [Piccolia ochrophora]|nr:MAG: hypothetical protein M1833_007379 [Piccolia ochrophora]